MYSKIKAILLWIEKTGCRISRQPVFSGAVPGYFGSMPAGAPYVPGLRRLEFFLACSAYRAYPVVRQICKCGAGLYTVVGIADSRVIHISAGITFIHS